MKIKEVALNDEILEQLISLSKQWEKEDSCYGYSQNSIDDIKSNRIFVVIDDDIIAYLFGHKEKAKNKTTIYQENDEYFVVEEIFVKKEYRNQGIGTKLFKYVENIIKDDINLIVLSTAAINYRAILHFYIEEVGMEFWYATLFKKV